jgi:hypothetical protein
MIFKLSEGNISFQNTQQQNQDNLVPGEGPTSVLNVTTMPIKTS